MVHARSSRAPTPQQPQSPGAQGGTFDALFDRELSHGDEAVRVAALRTLQGICSRTDPTLAGFVFGATRGAQILAAVKDRSAAVRKRALELLRYLAGFVDGAIPDLIGALADDDVECREAAAKTLASLKPSECLGSTVEDAWRSAVGHKKAETCRAALRLLRHHPPERAAFVMKLCRKAIRDNRADVREAAIELVRHTTPDVAAVTASALRAALGAEEVNVRLGATATLGWLGPEAVSAVSKLTDVMLGDPEPTVRNAAVRAALRIDPDSTRIFPTLAKLPGENTRDAIVELLSTTGEQGRGLRRRLQAHWSAEPRDQPNSEPPVSTGDSPAPDPAPTPPRDGPDDRGNLWWEGTPHHVPRTPFRLLNYMWGKDKKKIEKVEKHVWGQREIDDGPIADALHDLKVIMKKAGVPWYYGREGALIVKKSDG
jgi:HEAT repeat protein